MYLMANGYNHFLYKHDHHRVLSEQKLVYNVRLARKD